VLQVCTCVLVRQTTELFCLHHRDEGSAKLEVSSPRVDSGPNGHIGDSGGGVVTQCLDHSGSSGWCGGDWFTCRCSGRRRSDTRPALPLECLRVFYVVIRQVVTTHTLSCFYSTTIKKQAELAYTNYGCHYMHVIMIMSY
jgi:hypothetical protein